MGDYAWHHHQLRHMRRLQTRTEGVIYVQLLSCSTDSACAISCPTHQWTALTCNLSMPYHELSHGGWTKVSSAVQENLQVAGYLCLIFLPLATLDAISGRRLKLQRATFTWAACCKAEVAGAVKLASPEAGTQWALAVDRTPGLGQIASHLASLPSAGTCP